MKPLTLTDFKSLFDSIPGPLLVIDPAMIVVAANDAYLRATATNIMLISGQPLMNISHYTDANIRKQVDVSLQHVLANKQPDEMAVTKISINLPDKKAEERCWRIVHTPILNAKQEVEYIIQHITDVTESHNEIEELKKTERDYQLLVNGVNEYAIYMIDTAGCVASWNSGAERIKGYTASEIIGKPISAFYTHEDIANRVPEKNLQSAMESGQFSTEGWRLRKNGDLFWANIVITALKDENGNLYGYSKITRDITESKKASDHVEFLNRQINQSNDAIYTVDEKFKIKSWNKGAQKVYGFTEEEVMGKESNMLLRTSLSPQQIKQIVKEIAITDYWSGEIKRKKKNGSDIYVLSSNSTIRDRTGAIIGYTAVSFDITEQKRLGEQVTHLAAIVEQSSEAIISRGLDRRLMSWNKGAEILFGYTKDEAIGKTAIELGFLKITAKELEDIGRTIIEQGRWESEKTFYHKNGSSFIGAVAANAVMNEYGEISSMVFIIKDISLQRQMEQQLKKYNEELEEKIKIRTAHILKTESRFRALIENSNDIVSLMDESFQVIYRSPSASRITGWTNEEMMQVSGMAKIHPDDLSKAKDIVSVLMKNPGMPVNCLFRNQHKDGHYLWLEGVAVNLLHEEFVEAIVFNFRDISERIEAEEKRRATENRFRALIENSNDIITMMDSSFHLIYRSPAATKILGWTDEDMIGIPGTTNIHPDDKPYAAEVVKEVLNNPRKIISTQFRMQTKTGTYVWLEGTLTNLLDEEYIQSIVFNFRNITERVEAEEEIKRSNERFELVVAATNDVIWDWNMDNNIFWRNKNYYTHFGYDEKLASEDVNAWQNGIHPDDKERVLASITKSIEENQHFWTNEYRYLKADQSIATVLDCGYILYNDNGKAYRMVGAMLDITNRKKAEQDLKKSFEEKEALSERLATILNTLPATIALLDVNGNIVDVNDAWRNFANENGLTGKDYCIGDNYITVAKESFGKDEEDGLAVAKGILAVLHKDINEFVYEYPCHSPEEERWFRMVITPLHHSDYGGAVVMHTDISEVRRLEQERLKSKTEEQRKITQAMLQGQEKERSAIGAELHDNVNQILVATKILLSIVKKQPEKNKSIINSSIENIQKAIDENRKIAHELVAPDMKATDFHIELEKLTTEMLTISGIEVVVNTNNFDEELLDDQRKLAVYRILQEQCTNIVKYACARKVTVTLQTYAEMFTMCIADDGKGTEINKTSGGIGLKNINGRLSIFNGTISIHSAPNKGFILEVGIPLE